MFQRRSLAATDLSKVGASGSARGWGMIATKAVLSILSVCVCGAVVLSSIVMVSPSLQKTLQVGADTRGSSNYLFDAPVVTGIPSGLTLNHSYNYSLTAKASSQVEELLTANNTTHWWWVFVLYCEKGVSPSDLTLTTSVLNGSVLMSGEVQWYPKNESTMVGLGNMVPVTMAYHPGTYAPDSRSVDSSATMNGTLAFHRQGDYSLNITVASVDGKMISAVSPSKMLGSVVPPSVDRIEDDAPPTLSPSSSQTPSPPEASAGQSDEPSSDADQSKEFFTNLRIEGYWPMESGGHNVSISSSGQMVGQPVAGLNYQEVNKTSTISAGHAYYFWANADTQQAYIDFLKADGFHHDNVWGRAGANQNIPIAKWQIVVSSPGISTEDVIMNSGWGWPSQANAMAWRPFTQSSDGVGAQLDSDPSYYSMSMGLWGMGQWTDADIVVGNFPAQTPAAIQFEKPGTYTLTFYLVNSLNGNVVSQKISTTLNVVGSAISANCSRPWPSEVNIINKPDTLVPGQTYSLQARMMVQNYDANCTASPWYFATNTQMEWTIAGTSGQTSVTDGNGVATIQFVCPSEPNVTVTASWAGNSGYKEASATVSLATQSSAEKVLINEYEPNPAGEDSGNEWVELFNSGGTAVDLTGWKLTTTRGDISTQGITGTIGPKQFLVVKLSGQFIDNEADSLLFLNGTGSTVDTTQALNDIFDNSSTLQRVPDGGSSWLLREGSMGASNGS